jgi:hypothetical protein
VSYDPLDAAFTLDEVKRTFGDDSSRLHTSNQFNPVFDSLPLPDISLEQKDRIDLSRKFLASNPRVSLSEAQKLHNELGTHPLIYSLAGDAYVRLKLFSDAENCFFAALSLGSKDPSILINLANLCHLRGDQCLAYRWLEMLSTHTPDHAHLKQVQLSLFPSGKPKVSTTPFQYNPEHASKGDFS